MFFTQERIQMTEAKRRMKMQLMIFSVTGFKNPVTEKQTPLGKRTSPEKSVKISMKFFKLILFSNY